MSETLNWPDNDSDSGKRPPEENPPEGQKGIVRHHTKRIELPGGRLMDIVYFSRESAEHPSLPGITPEEVPVEPEAPAELHICPECKNNNVYPIEWEELARKNEYQWRLYLRCPDCEWRNQGEYSEEAVARLDDALNYRTERLLTALQRLARLNMKNDVESLSAAIRDGHIQPMDF